MADVFGDLLWAARVLKPAAWLQVVEQTRLEFRDHAAEVYSKGFHHQTEHLRQDLEYAVSRSLSGLARFLELPVDEYGQRVPLVVRPADAYHLRAVCSGLLCGVLQGYAQARFGDVTGRAVLPDSPLDWAPYLAFLSARDLEDFAAVLPTGGFSAPQCHTMLAFAQAVDDLHRRDSQVICLPMVCEFRPDKSRIEVALRLCAPVAARPRIAVHCYYAPLAAEWLSSRDVTAREADLTCAPFGPDLRDALDAMPGSRANVLDSSVADAGALRTVAARLLARLLKTIQTQSGAAVRSAPITHNTARGFPLHTPRLKGFFRVYRRSVQELLRSVESGTGVHLWCSVRRSGKTTSCFDLTNEDTAPVIVQTCQPTDPDPAKGLLFERICAALESGQRIGARFFRDAVEQCCDTGIGSGKSVLVIDEYEELFVALRQQSEHSDEIRHKVALPLMAQMSSFAQDNLLILVGQQPDAHFVLMDRNQLSAHVHQDTFPLFHHDIGATDSEFPLLVRKILTEDVEFEPSFVDAVWAETGGHPWLTANLLTDVMDWAIRGKRPQNPPLSAADFQYYAQSGLTRQGIRECTEYDYFDRLVSDVLTPAGRAREPWLHGVFWVTRCIATDFADTMSCSIGDFGSIVDDLSSRMMGLYKRNPETWLRTAVQSNFLSEVGGTVRPRIPLMARIAAAATPVVAY